MKNKENVMKKSSHPVSFNSINFYAILFVGTMLSNSFATAAEDERRNNSMRQMSRFILMSALAHSANNYFQASHEIDSYDVDAGQCNFNKKMFFWLSTGASALAILANEVICRQQRNLELKNKTIHNLQHSVTDAQITIATKDLIMKVQYQKNVTLEEENAALRAECNRNNMHSELLRTIPRK